jgi:hypothetical protein
MTQEPGISPFGLELLGKLDSPEIQNTLEALGWNGKNITYLGAYFDSKGKRIGDTYGMERETGIIPKHDEMVCVGHFVWIQIPDRVVSDDKNAKKDTSIRAVILSSAEACVIEDISKHENEKDFVDGIISACANPGCYMGNEERKGYPVYKPEKIIPMEAPVDGISEMVE